MKKLLVVNNEKDADDLGWIPIIMEAIAKVEAVEFVVIHHSQLSEQKTDEIKPDFMYLTGRASHDWTLDEILQDYSSTLETLKTTTIPTLGVCAGHQLIGVAYGARFGKMIEEPEGEEPIREKEFQKINIITDAPLFKGMETPFTCYEFHRDELKNVPEGFEVLASTDMCKIQVLKHKEKPLYGVQFHPEQYNDENLDGKTIISNFLNLNQLF